MDTLRLIVGLAFIAFGIFIFIVSQSWLALIVNVGIGILILVFGKAENQIEQRKDINTSTNKK